jgi:hypothetical protein
MIRAVAPGQHPVEVFDYFRLAFALDFANAKPITDWLVYGGSDDDIHSAMWPRIDARRESWTQG